MNKIDETYIDEALLKEILEDGLLSALAIHELLLDENGKAYDYRFLFVNKKFYELTGIKEDIVGKTVLEAMPNTEKYWIEQYEKVIKFNEILEFEQYSQELDRHYSVIAKKVGDNNIFAVDFRDVTDIIKTNKQLERSQEELSTMLSHLGQGVIATDVDSKIIYINEEAEEMLGKKNSEVESVNFYEATNFKFLKDESKLSTIKRGFLSGDYESINFGIEDDLVIVSKAGKQIPINATVSAMKDKNGKYTGAIIIFKNATHEKEVREKINYISTHDHLTDNTFKRKRVPSFCYYG